MHTHIKAFLEFLRLNRNVSANTVRAYESDLSQLVEHVARVQGVKRAALEPPDELRRRVDEAAGHVPIEHLAISPQCGFASVARGNLLSADDQWRKLQLVADTARRVWGRN